MLTQERLKEVLHYDPDTGVFTWKKYRVGTVAGHIHKGHGYLTIGVDKKVYLAHRLAWLYVYGTWPVDQLDHRNRVRTDNRISNLRESNQFENAQNKNKASNNSSGYPGVSFHSRDMKYAAYITVSKKRKSLGYFSSAEEAYEARKQAKAKLHTFQPVLN